MGKFLLTLVWFVLIFIISACQGNNSTIKSELDYSAMLTEDLEKQHKKGDLQATFTLGYNYFFNDDASIKENVTQIDDGLSYLEDAHERGHEHAHSILSTIYINGLFDIPVDKEKANSYSLEGAQRGSAIGKVNYGIHNITNPDQAVAQRAHDYLVDVATVDDFGGMANEFLARLYYFGSEIFEVDYESARLFAENCVIFGQSKGWCEYILGRDFDQGWGGPKDNTRSAMLFIQSANAGYSKSMWHAGMNALNGNGIPKNEIEAFNWIKKGAELGDQDSLISLGVMYALGQGTEIDYIKAYNAYEDAAKTGSAHAIRGMAGMYCDGQGLEIDHDMCGAGLWLAMKHGDGEAEKLLKSKFDIINEDLTNLNKQPPAAQKFWTDQFPWLSEEGK